MSKCVDNQNWVDAKIRAAVTKRKQKQERVDVYNLNPKRCKECQAPIEYDKRLVNQYCSKSCSSKNSANLSSNFSKDKRNQYLIRVELWKSGKISGNDAAGGLRRFIRKYLFEKFDSKCTSCGWNKVNPVTGKTPLEVEHIDGNSENNAEENLTLFCPNCHSLTPTYKNLNKGKGRRQRMRRYNEGKTF